MPWAQTLLSSSSSSSLQAWWAKVEQFGRVHEPDTVGAIVRPCFEFFSKVQVRTSRNCRLYQT